MTDTSDHVFAYAQFHEGIFVGEDVGIGEQFVKAFFEPGRAQGKCLVPGEARWAGQ